ncbi:MAG: aminodeoxychorismate/anthranilate synthase component II [Myxococcota bacterium]
MSHLVIIDNIDSFTFNLVQAFRQLPTHVTVLRHDVAVEDVLEHAPSHLVVSPGPGRPEHAGNSLAILDAFARTGRPILGVCLGHQCIASVFGGRIVHAPTLRHGKTSSVHHDERGLFRGLPSPFPAGRYHSLVAEEASLPDDLEVSARTDDGVVMAIRHRSRPIVGIQFHPESVLTPDGDALLANFLALPSERKEAA